MSSKKASKTLTIAGIVILVLGSFVTIGVGLVAPVLINDMLEDGLKDQLILTEEDWDEAWSFDSNLVVTTEGDSWLYTGPENTEVPPVYDSFYIFNITNYDFASNSFTGGSPVYDEIGPFVCRKVDNRTILEWTDDTVTYQEFSWYLVNETGHQPDLSLDSIIVSWNPLYRVYCLGAGNEANLHYGLGQSLLNGSIYGMAAALGGLAEAEAQWGNLTYSTALGLEAAFVVQNLGLGSLNMTSAQVDSFLYNADKNYAVGENITALAIFRSTYTDLTATYASLYGITANQVIQLGTFLDVLVPSWMWEVGVSYVAKRTFGDWFFTFQDSIAGVSTALVGNGTLGPVKTINTGAKDMDKIWQQEAHDGIETFEAGTTGYWMSDEQVGGTTGDGFAPGVSKEDTLAIWGGIDTFRRSELIYLGEGDVGGIDTLKFYLPPAAWKADPNYYQYIDGFFNMTVWNMGVPMFLSPLHYQSYPDVESVAEEDNTVLYIEPNTGFPLKGIKRMQFNIQLFNFSLYNTDVQGTYSYTSAATGAVYLEPFGYAERLGSVENLPADKFAELKDGFELMNLAKNLAGWLNIGGIGIGVILVVAGAAMIVVPRVRK
ncbi:MAG: hypothetical protein ACXAEI_16975 [Candidatus Hodarchaeales archaeon]|jgi:hypothetical protein